MRKYWIHFILAFYCLIGIFTIFYFNGTGDSGDSVMHYLYSRYAPFHPEEYFFHWAKPVFTFLSSPFAQFGFVGIKVFNFLVSLATLYFTIKVAEKLRLRFSFIAALIFIFAPLNYVLTFSGLTEPLFALFLVLGIYLILRKKYLASALLISFMPFVRSEGLIIIGVFAFYFLVSRKWKAIPFLVLGHIVLSIAGFFVYHDFLWVFNRIPYDSEGSVYGSGNLFHFVTQLNYILGIPIYVLFWLGLISLMVSWVKRKTVLEEVILIYGSFLAYFLFHSLAWYLGLFNSMGLTRVMIGIMPLFAIIGNRGLNFLKGLFSRWGKTPSLVIQVIVILYIIIFPFTPNPAAVKWDREMDLDEEQQLSFDVADFLNKNKDEGDIFSYAYPYLNVALNVDPFDSTLKAGMKKSRLSSLEHGDWIIWDTWFAPTEAKITREYLNSIKHLKQIKEFRNGAGEVKYVVYRVR